jgi:hypothetical protein
MAVSLAQAGSNLGDDWAERSLIADQHPIANQLIKQLLIILVELRVEAAPKSSANRSAAENSEKVFCLEPVMLWVVAVNNYEADRCREFVESSQHVGRMP